MLLFSSKFKVLISPINPKLFKFIKKFRWSNHLVVSYINEDGTLSDKKIFISISPEQGKPDGMTVDEEGFLWFCGRKNERVELSDTLLCTDKVENVLNLHEAVKRSALVGVYKNDVTEAVLIVEPHDSSFVNDVNQSMNLVL